MEPSQRLAAPMALGWRELRGEDDLRADTARVPDLEGGDEDPARFGGRFETVGLSGPGKPADTSGERSDGCHGPSLPCIVRPPLGGATSPSGWKEL